MTYSVIFAAPLLIIAIVSAFRFVGCTEDFGVFEGGGDETPEVETLKGVGILSGSGTLSAVATFTPTHEKEITSFTPAGPPSYLIPEWCNFIDLFLLGAGGAGTFGEPTGTGGAAGSWNTVTLWRGDGEPPSPEMVPIPRDTTSIDITVGVGGAAGTLVSPPGAGGDTTATATGLDPRSGAGGAGGASPDATGKGPQSQTLHGTQESGGADQTTAGQQGQPPGGGGAAGVFANGGDGADGAAWAVARQT